MTFTRDIVLCLDDTTAVLLANDGPRGAIEPLVVRRWLRKQGIAAIGLGRHRVDGGNVLRRHRGGWLIGAKLGADGRAERALAKILAERTGERVDAVPLATERFPHLDMVLADLDGRGWLAHPPALAGDLASPAWRRILGDRPVIELDEDETRQLAANVVCVGTAVVGTSPPRSCRESKPSASTSEPSSCATCAWRRRRPLPHHRAAHDADRAARG